MNEATEKRNPVEGLRPRLLIICGAIALVAFLAGVIPMWLSAHQAHADLRELKRQGVISRLQNTLASAAIDARRGQYEPARQEASQFYTALSADLGRGAESAFNQPQQEKLAPLLAQRDDLVTLLARSDPASADRLADLYVAYRKGVETPHEEPKKPS